MTLDSSLIPPNWHSRSILTDAIMGKAPSFRQLDKTYLSAIFYKQDETLAKAARDDFQDIFNHIIARSIRNPHEAELKEELFCFRLLSFYPFLIPDNETVDFPLTVEGRIQKISYRFQRIELTDSKTVSPLVAYGLATEDKAPNLLLFKGTTFPADEGFIRSILADFTPFKSVGADVLKNPSPDLLNWIKDKKNIIVSGISLGGSLAQHFGAHFPDKVAKIYAFSAPKILKAEAPKDGPVCYRIDTAGDVVVKVGDSTLPNTTSYEIKTDKHFNVFWRHIVAPESLEGKEISEKEEEKTSIYAKLHKIFSPLVYMILGIFLSIFLFFSSLIKAGTKLLSSRPIQSSETEL